MPPYPRPRAHAHGDDEEEEEDHGPRVDGPPFMDIVAKPGKGFEIDYSQVQKSLGPSSLSLSDFLRDLEMINRVYIPTAHRSYTYMRYGTVGMMGGLVMFIVMGIIGGTPSIRATIIPICLGMFLLGLVSFLYSKWVEQGTIKEGAAAVKRLLDEEVNPKYTDHPNKITYTVCYKLFIIVIFYTIFYYFSWKHNFQ